MKPLYPNVILLVIALFLIIVVLFVGDPKPKKQFYSCCGSDVCLTQHHHEMRGAPDMSPKEAVPPGFPPHD